MLRELIHPQMLSRLADFYPSLCTIEQDVSTDADVDSYGQARPNWQALAGHTAIPCAVSTTGGREMNAPPQSYGVATSFIALRGYYPSVQARMRAVVGSTTWDILVVERDSLSKTTRLTVEVVE